jgi:hypothetical protein
MKNVAQSIGFCLFAVYVFLSGNVFGQGEANIWYFGQNAGLNFNGGGPTVLTNSAMNTIEGCATISDASGNLLFYTDGQKVWDKTHTVMTNGNGLLGRTSSTQTAMAVGIPGSTTQYYVFTTDAEPNPCSTESAGIAGTKSGLRYSIVDMTLGTNGDVVAASKNTLIQADPIMEGMTLVPKSNAIDYWLINHDVGTGSFKVRSVTAGGIGTATTYTVGLNTNDACRYISSIKSNSCYTKIAVAYHEYNAVEVYDFDFASGAITNAVSITAGVTFPYGLEFSPSGNFLYYTNDIYGGSGGLREVWQYNIAGTTKVKIGNGPAAHDRIGALQLGPDKKIYVANLNYSGTTQVGVIGAPDNLDAGNGVASAYTAGAITTGSSSSNLSQMGLPNYIKSYVSNAIVITAPSICQNVSASFSYTFSGVINAAAGSVKWQWGDATANTLDQNPASHTYTTAGPYTITLTIKDNCGINHVKTLAITVNAQVSSAGTISCGPPVVGNVTSPNGAYKYVWYSDAAATKPIATGTTNVSLIMPQTGNVYLAAQTAVSTTPYSLTNGPASAPNNAGSATGTIRFTVNKGVTFNTFDWASALLSWSASNVTQPYTITLRDVPFTANYYTNTQNVAVTGPLGGNAPTNYTETVNKALGPGNYEIVISGTGGNIRVSSSCTASSADAQGALTYNTSGTCIATNFTYQLSAVTVTTPLACSNIATISYNCPLPVTWLGFSGRRMGEGSAVLLDWSTATEENSKVFYIQRSLDGIHFETVGVQQAVGNSNTIKQYEYIDYTAPAGNVYYRLLQEDVDGASTNSKIVYVNGVGSLNLSLVPNPGNGNFTVTGLPADVKLNIAVYSITGQLIYQTVAYPGEGIDLENIAKGLYIVKIVSGATEQSIRYINQ